MVPFATPEQEICYCDSLIETLILNWTKSPQTETWEMQIDNFTTIQEKKKRSILCAKKNANISKNSQISAKIRKSGFLHFLVFQDFPDFILISGWGSTFDKCWGR